MTEVYSNETLSAAEAEYSDSDLETTAEAETISEVPEELPDADSEDIPEALPDYAAMAESDLAEIHASFPRLQGIRDLKEIDQVSRYGELREMGLSAREAFIATNLNRILSSVSVREDRGKSHLHGVSPRSADPASSHMSGEEMRAAKALFSDLSEREIESLFRRAKS